MTNKAEAVLRVRVGCDLRLDSDYPVPLLVLVRARPEPGQRLIAETRRMDPAVPFTEYIDVYGNTCWRLTAPGGPISVRYDATFDLDRSPDLVVPEAPLIPVEDL